MVFSQCQNEKAMGDIWDGGVPSPVLGGCSVEVTRAATSLQLPCSFCAILCQLYLLSLTVQVLRRWTDSY